MNTDNWTLNKAQHDYLDKIWDVIEAAYADDNMDALKAIAASESYQTLFGDMGIDEAVDRFESAKG